MILVGANTIKTVFKEKKVAQTARSRMWTSRRHETGRPTGRGGVAYTETSPHQTRQFFPAVHGTSTAPFRKASTNFGNMDPRHQARTKPEKKNKNRPLLTSRPARRT